MGAYADDDYSQSVAFGGWLKERRLRKGLSLEYSAFELDMSPQRLKEIEKGCFFDRLTELEILGFARTYGLDPRAIKMRMKEHY